MKKSSNQNKVPMVQALGISNIVRNSLLLFLGVGCFAGAGRVAAQSILLSPTTPTVGDGVQNLNFSTAAGNNAAVQYVGSDYLAGDNSAALGQTFTTGSNASGYSLSAISLRQVSWGTTWWDYTGGNITLQIFSLGSGSGGVWNITPLATETAAVGGAAGGLASGTPASPMWMTFTLGSTVSLNANTMYGFQMMSDGTGGNDGFFIEADGSNANPYAGGFALGTDKVSGSLDTGLVWDGNNGQPSDRAFVASMTIQSVPEPSTLVLAGLGGLGLLMLARRRSAGKIST